MNMQILDLAIEESNFHLLQGCCFAATYGNAHEPIRSAKLAASGWEVQVEVHNAVKNRLVTGVNLGSRGLVAPVFNKSLLNVRARLRGCGLG